MHRYKELEIWKKAMKLSVKIYQFTNSFPVDEKYGLVAQMRRSAVSIPSNIAEGAGRNSNGEFWQFLGVAQGAAFELETQALIARELNFLSGSNLDHISSEVNALSNMIFKKNLS